MRHAAAATLRGCLLALALAAPLQAEPNAPPQRLSPREQHALDAGALVSRALRFAHAGGSYVGGVSYQVLEVRPELVLSALSEVANWPAALPRTKSARLLKDRDGLTRVELVQGGAFIEARYTVLLERADGETIRFWLDPSQPHDIRDVWGYFRVQALPGGRSLVTVGAALDLGDGLARLLFEDKIAKMLLRAPRNIREFVEPRALALSR